MKSRLMQFLGILALYAVVRSSAEFGNLSIQMLVTGYNFEDGKMSIPLLIFNSGLICIFLSMMNKTIVSAYSLRQYVAARAGNFGVSLYLVKAAFKEIAIIIFYKQIIYGIAFCTSFTYSKFYLYDTLSTFLTLLVYGCLLIILIRRNVNSSIGFFLVIIVAILLQSFSYEYPFIHIFIIATANWENSFLSMILFKILLIGICVKAMIELDFENSMIGVKIND